MKSSARATAGRPGRPRRDLGAQAEPRPLGGLRLRVCDDSKKCTYMFNNSNSNDNNNKTDKHNNNDMLTYKTQLVFVTTAGLHLLMRARDVVHACVCVCVYVCARGRAHAMCSACVMRSCQSSSLLRLLWLLVLVAIATSHHDLHDGQWSFACSSLEWWIPRW